MATTPTATPTTATATHPATRRQIAHYGNLMRRRKAGDTRAQNALDGYCQSYYESTGFIPGSYRQAVLYWANFGPINT